MYEAARVDDPIYHTSALAGFLIGAIIGIAIIAVASFAFFTCGFLAGLILSFLADQILEISPEIPDWLRQVVDVLYVVAGMLGGLAGAWRLASGGKDGVEIWYKMCGKIYWWRNGRDGHL